ncbi:MAG: hypothetical protein EOO77_38960, partial [Oxalobacteraceae bacterium]
MGIAPIINRNTWFPSFFWWLPADAGLVEEAEQLLVDSEPWLCMNPDVCFYMRGLQWWEVKRRAKRLGDRMVAVVSDFSPVNRLEYKDAARYSDIKQIIERSPVPVRVHLRYTVGRSIIAADAAFVEFNDAADATLFR